MGYCFAFSGACPEALSSRAEAVRCVSGKEHRGLAALPVWDRLLALF